MRIKKNKKSGMLIVPVMTKEVYNDYVRCNPGITATYEETISALESADEIQSAAIKEIKPSTNRKMVFTYLDEEYMTWLKAESAESNEETITKYTDVLYKKTNDCSELERLWKKNTGKMYTLHYLLFYLDSKLNRSGIFHIRKPDISGFKKLLNEFNTRNWISQVPVSSDDAKACRHQLESVSRQRMEGEKVRLGLLDENDDITICGNIAVIPFLCQSKTDCIIHANCFERTMPSVAFPANVVGMMADSMSTDEVQVIPAGNCSIPAYEYQNIIIGGKKNGK